LVGQKAQIIADGEHPARLGCGAGRGELSAAEAKRRQHRFQQWQRKHDARATQKLTARDGAPGGDERAKLGVGAGAAGIHDIIS